MQAVSRGEVGVRVPCSVGSPPGRAWLPATLLSGPRRRGVSDQCHITGCCVACSSAPAYVGAPGGHADTDRCPHHFLVLQVWDDPGITILASSLGIPVLLVWGPHLGTMWLVF